MADSHDHLEAIKRAVRVFNEEQVELVIHAGDLISPFTAPEFMKLDSPFQAIFGNNDGERDGLKKAYRDLCSLEDFKELQVDDKQIAVMHGSNQVLVDAIASCGKYDVVIRGHSHQVQINGENGKTMIVNPGEACGYLSGDQTVILMEPGDLSYRVVYL